MYDVSIIVPIYNAEKYIEKCAISLFEQDYKNIEYVFVNDKTPDKSMEILNEVIKRYPNRQNDIRIISKIQNEGLGKARKTGYENSTGKYIIHIDSDDWCELNMISSLYDKAISEDADIVCCDFFENYKNEEIYVSQNLKSSIENPIKLIYKNVLWPMVWLYLAKRYLYKSIDFSILSYAEDNYLTTQLFYFSNKSIYLNSAFLHYNKANSNSLTKKYDIDKEILGLKNLDENLQNFLKKVDIWGELENSHYSFIIRVIATKFKKDFFEVIKKVNSNANQVKYILKDDNLSIAKKAFYSLIFIKMLWLFCLLQDFKKNFKKE